MKTEKIKSDRTEPPANLASLSLRLLEIFLHVVREGNMGATAEKLGLSQAAISQSISALESALGTKLFDRSVRPPALTLTGRTVHSYAVEIITKVRELERFAQDGADRKIPILKIGMLNSFVSTGGSFVLHQLQEYVEEWNVTSSYSATSFHALVDRQSDVIITSDESPPPRDVQVYPCFSEDFVVAVPASSPRNSNDLRVLAQKLDFIGYGRTVHMSRSVNEYLAAAGVSPSKRYQFNTTDAALHMVADGFGWALVTPLILLKSESLLDSLRIVQVKGMNIHRTICVAARKGDGEDIARRIHLAASTTMRDVLLPRIVRLLPELAKHVTIYAPADAK